MARKRSQSELPGADALYARLIAEQDGRCAIVGRYEERELMSRLRVIVRDDYQTEMLAATEGEAKGFAKHMIRDGKGFDARPNEDGTWTFVVYEVNEPSRWEYA